MKKILLLLIMALAFMSCSDDASNPASDDDDSTGMVGTLHEDGYYEITAAQAKTMIEENQELVVIDVSPLWADGHLPGALDLPGTDLDDAISSFDMDASYLVYCHSDDPARAGAVKLVEAGFGPVYRLIDNYGGWVDAGYDVETEADMTAVTDEMVGTLHEDGYYEITAAEAKAMIDDDEDLVVIDVSPLWADGHLPGALDLPGTDLDDAISSFDMDVPYLVYCHGDAPSRAGAVKLVEAGFSPVYRLIGNYGAWEDAEYPIETE